MKIVLHLSQCCKIIINFTLYINECIYKLYKNKIIHDITTNKMF